MEHTGEMENDDEMITIDLAQIPAEATTHSELMVYYILLFYDILYISVSLSLSIYIYIYTHTEVGVFDDRAYVLIFDTRRMTLGFKSANATKQAAADLRTKTERLAQYGWKPHRDCLAQKSLSGALLYWYVRETQGYGFIEFEVSNSTISTAFPQPLKDGVFGGVLSGTRSPVDPCFGDRLGCTSALSYPKP